MEDTKKCSKCKQNMGVGAFSKLASSKDGLQSQCKMCNADYYATHREKRMAYNAAYDAAHSKEKASRDASYRSSHREKDAARLAAWAKANPDKRRATEHRRRARKKGCGGIHTDADVKRQGEAQRWTCWWCGKPCADDYHIDHLIPLAKGGHNNPSNVVIACPNCNLRKSDKLPEEWAGRLF